jgi:uncharacterized protein
MRVAAGVSLVVFLLIAPSVFSQSVEVNRQNRTIEVIVTETVRVDPEIANITMGCIEYGQTHDQAYQANLAVADKVIKALLAAGVSKDQMESSSIDLSESNRSDLSDPSASVRKMRQFKAHQSWHLRVGVSDAQRLIDIAVQAGANGVEDVSWDVADAEALESRARVAALEKARATAAEMAKGEGGKVGDLLYGSNMVNGILGLLTGNRTVQTTSASLNGEGSGFPTPAFSLQLFPVKVERQATVRAVFALD